MNVLYEPRDDKDEKSLLTFNLQHMVRALPLTLWHLTYFFNALKRHTQLILLSLVALHIRNQLPQTQENLQFYRHFDCESTIETTESPRKSLATAQHPFSTVAVSWS